MAQYLYVFKGSQTQNRNTIGVKILLKNHSKFVMVPQRYSLRLTKIEDNI